MKKQNKKHIIRLDKKVIGILDWQKRVFVKEVKESKHLFRKLDSWGIDAKFFEDVLLPNNYKIRIIDKERNIVYETDAETFKKNGYYLHFKGKEDYRTQIFLPRRYFEKLSKKDFDLREMVITLNL